MINNQLTFNEYQNPTSTYMPFKFYRTLEIGVDLGTANTLVIYENNVIIDEPSIIAIDSTTSNVIAVGKEAMLMHEKTHPSIKTIKPLKDGVIANFSAAEDMIKSLIKKIKASNKIFFEKKFSMLICIPSSITEVEKRAVKDSAVHAGADEVLMIYEPMAAAIGAGLDINSPNGIMIIDIGGGTTEIALISLSGMVNEFSVRIAGNTFTDDIINYIKKQHNLLIGEKTAERIKLNIGSAMDCLEENIEEYPVIGRDMLTGIPKTINLHYSEVAHAIDKSLSKIEESILKALEHSPPELCSDLYEYGIHVCGGGALLKGLDKRLNLKTKLKINLVEEPLKAVVRGTAIALSERQKYKKVLFN